MEDTEEKRISAALHRSTPRLNSYLRALRVFVAFVLTFCRDLCGCCAVFFAVLCFWTFCVGDSE